MPYYEFECRQCKETFTVRQTFDEHDRSEKVKCPKCGSGDVESQIAQVMVKTSKKS